MTEPAPEETPKPAAAPQPETAPDKKEKKDKPDDAKGFPVGQAAVGGVGAITVGSYALASVVGPLGWLAAPVAAGAAGAGYVAYRRRKKRGGSEQTTRTTTTKASGGRTSGGGLLGGRGSGSRSGSDTTSAKRSGGLPGGSAAVRGGSSAPNARGSAALRRTGDATPPRPGSRGAAPRGGGGGTTPRPSSGGRRTPGGDTAGQRRTGGSTPRGGSPDTTASKRKTTPPGGTGSKPGTSPRTPGGRMTENRWGGTTGPTPTKKPGAVRRGAAKARDWADDKTGRRMSTGWKAARGQEGFKNRRRAAGQAVRDAGGGGIIAAIVGVLAALFAGIASLFSRSGTDEKKPADAKATPGDTPTAGEATATGTGPADTQNETHRRSPTGGAQATGSTDPWAHETWDADSTPPPTTTPSTTHTGGTTMSGLPAAAIAHDMAAAMARYEPSDAWAVVAESKQWPDVSTQVAMSVKAYADRLEGARFPLNPAIIGKLQEYFQALAASRSIADELYPLLQKAHAEDIAKQDAPRGDESKWNV